MTTFGVWRVSTGRAQAYKDGIQVPGQSGNVNHAPDGGNVAIFSLATTAGFFASRVECWTKHPLAGGSLLLADDFNYANLTALAAVWTAAPPGGASAVTGTSVRLDGGAVSNGIYRTMPSGTNYVQVEGSFGGTGSPHWGMVSLDYNPSGSADGSSPPGYYGTAGYRVLLRETGGAVQLPDLTVVAPSVAAVTTPPLLRQRQKAL